METVWGTYYSYLAVVDLAQLRENTEYIKTQKHPKLSLKYAKCLKVHSFTVYILYMSIFWVLQYLTSHFKFNTFLLYGESAPCGVLLDF